MLGEADLLAAELGEGEVGHLEGRDGSGHSGLRGAPGGRPACPDACRGAVMQVADGGLAPLLGDECQEMDGLEP